MKNSCGSVNVSRVIRAPAASRDRSQCHVIANSTVHTSPRSFAVYSAKKCRISISTVPDRIVGLESHRVFSSAHLIAAWKISSSGKPTQRRPQTVSITAMVDNDGRIVVVVIFDPRSGRGSDLTWVGLDPRLFDASRNRCKSNIQHT